MKDRNRTSGIIGVVLGGILLISALSRIIRDSGETSGAYETGQVIGLVFAGVVFVAGLYYLNKAKAEKDE